MAEVNLQSHLLEQEVLKRIDLRLESIINSLLYGDNGVDGFELHQDFLTRLTKTQKYDDDGFKIESQ